MTAFIEDCQVYIEPGECPLLDLSVDGAKAEVTSLLEEIDAEPLPTDSGRELTQSLAVLGIVVTLYDSEFGWPLLRQALAEGFDGDGSTLLLLSDFYTERQDDGSYANNNNEVIFAVNCLDHGEEGNLDAAAASAPEFIEKAPIFGAYVAYGSLPCAHWPAPPTFEPHEIVAAGAAPILVVGTTRDPATPYEWAEALASQLESGVLLTRRGDGHTGYQQGNICIDEAIDTYLLTGEPPEDGTTCGAR